MLSRHLRHLAFAVLLVLAALCLPTAARAFCGFYVSGADAKLFNNATVVVLMRDGVRTVLSMQNNYQGPPQDFALVVPVPVVLQKENVKTLPSAIFARVDKLAAPRLVEYWEQDPCRPLPPPEPPMAMAVEEKASADDEDSAAERHGVKIEARFSVGEYNVLILSAEDSMGLDAFLRGQRYKIPPGSEPYLRPYVTGGSKFFVAKVDVKKVKFEGGQAMLSPLRFHYDSETFTLPVRLGLVNSAGTQDLIVHILGRSRYEVANYDNYPIPTNIAVTESVKAQFGPFYAALFDKVLAAHPRAVITEYAWDAGSCDPCPEPPMEPSEIVTLGADALPALQGAVEAGEVPYDLANNFTLTRLHVRYSKDALGEDLVFRAAPPINGGTGIPDPNGALPRGVQNAGYNNFQGRYVILHPWTGPIACENPIRGNWGGPIEQAAGNTLMVATNTAFAPRGGIDLASMLAGGESALQEGGDKLPSGSVDPQPWRNLPPSSGGCASCAIGAPAPAFPLGAACLCAALAGLAAYRARRLLLAVAPLAVVSASCSGSECQFEDGCNRPCETDEDCEEVEVKSGDPLVCRQMGSASDERERACTRACTSQADCGTWLCVCTESPSEGWCTILGRPQEATCRADSGSIDAMCTTLTRDLSTNCDCSITGSDLDACDHYVEMFPACEQELDAFFFCGLRLSTDAYCSGVAAETACGAEFAALEACTATTWTRYRAELCI